MIDFIDRFGLAIACLLLAGGWALFLVREVAHRLRLEWLDYRDERTEHFRRVEEMLEGRR